ncbi:GMC oxidoreductase [Streptomyces sp. NBC_00247]|uniref:GMC oxidoreductase n=1 Tax=Streptomyces sp. NBC_00247 TaxID=2975689 RepID=UPI002E2BD187|nr:GMC oxidoreductase [Streptomyces sp. NBC_00247]
MIIVGAGLAGLALARRLADSRAGRVLVIESGPDAGRDHYRWVNDPQQAHTMWLDPTADPHFWQPYQATDSAYRGIAGLRRRLGGRSLYWGGVAVPIEPWALDDGSWPRSVVDDLTVSWRGGQSLYHEATEELRQWTGTAALSDGRAVDLGGHRFDEAPRAVRTSPDGQRWQAYSPLGDWPESVEVVSDCHAVAVATDQDRITGLLVEENGVRRVIAAPKIVLAAGTVENSRLVLQALHRADSSGPVELTGLVDKLAQGFVVAFDPAAAPKSMAALAESGGLFLSRADADLRSSLFLGARMNEHGLMVVDCYCMGEQTRSATGRVWCEPGADLPWPTFVAGGLSEADTRMTLDQQRELQRLYEELCGEAGVSGTRLHFDEPFGSEDLAERLVIGDTLRVPGVPATYSFPIGSEQHEAGTLPLGGAVVDEHARVRSVDGLYVTGPATFPRTGAANPALTILALSARLAGELADSGSVSR